MPPVLPCALWKPEEIPAVWKDLVHIFAQLFILIITEIPTVQAEDS